MGCLLGVVGWCIWVAVYSESFVVDLIINGFLLFTFVIVSFLGF